MISQSNSNCLYKVTFTSSLQIGAIGKADLVLIHLFLISLDFPSRWFPAMSEGPLIGVPVLSLEILGKCLHVISPPLEEALSLLTPKEKFYFSVCSVNNFSWSISSALVSLTIFYFQYSFLFTKSKGGVGSHIGLCLNNLCTLSFLLLADSFWLYFADRPLHLPVCFSVKNSCRFMGLFYYVL